MSEQAAALSRQESRKFFSKSKWKAKLSNDESSGFGGSKKSALNEQDVLDFLKPSTDKVASTSPLPSPRLDVVAAQKWMHAANVGKSRPAANTLPSSIRGKGQRPRMTKALTVSFVPTAPEIIGEGGDEAEEPVIEVSKHKAAANKPTTAAGLQENNVANGPSDRPGNTEERPALGNRAHTSAGEAAPLLQDKLNTYQLPPLQSVTDGGFGLQPVTRKRAPTGPQGPRDGISRPSVDSEDFRPKPLGRTQTGLSEIVHSEDEDRTPRLPNIDPSDYCSPVDSHKSLDDILERESDHTPEQPSALSRQRMRAEEGKALHEAFQHREDTSSGSPGSSRPSMDSNAYSIGSPQSYRGAMLGGSQQKSSYAPYTVTDKRPTSQDSHRSLNDDPPLHPGFVPGPTLRGTASSVRSGLYVNNVSQQRAPPEGQNSFQRPQPMQHHSHLGADASRPSSSSSNSHPIPSQLQPSPHGSLRTINSGHPTPKGTPNLQQGLEQPFKPPGLTIPQDLAIHRLGQDSGSVTNSPIEQNSNSAPGKDAALEDFAERVIHMNGIFRLTAEIDRPITSYSVVVWLRAAIWWFLRGRAGLEALIRSRGRDGGREQRLMQPHVDLAKALWILKEVIPKHPEIAPWGDFNPTAQLHNFRMTGNQDMIEVYETYEMILANLKALIPSMIRNRVMPPEQALIQGQDQSIWIKYPPFAADVQSILAGTGTRSLMTDTKQRSPNPSLYMPLADTKEQFCYGRMFVEVSVGTEDSYTDRHPLPCVLSILRARDDWTLKVAICSQSELVNLCVQKDRNLGAAWENVRWNPQSRSILIHLPRGFTLTVEFTDNDYRQLRGIYEYTNHVQASFQCRDNERLLHELTLKEFKYTDPSNPQAFPQERVKRCRAFIYEKYSVLTEGTGERHFHRGYRIVVATPPRNRTLSSVSHELGAHRPITYEMKIDPGGENTPAIVLRVKQDNSKHSCVMFLVFHDEKERESLWGVVTGMNMLPDETVFVHGRLKSFVVEQANPAESFTHSGHNAMQRLQWEDLVSYNLDPETENSEIPATVLSENLRVIARHAAGTFTDRMNLSPGELQIRLDTGGEACIRMLRNPQLDMTVATDVKRVNQGVPDALGEIFQTILREPTIRTYSFNSLPDLHAFQFATTGFFVKFDGVASSFAIARRRMVVPIYKKWEASNVRIQVVQQENIVQLLAFFEEFSHADSMNFQLRAMDVFEKVEKGGKSCLKLVDAKFALPAEIKKGDEEAAADPLRLIRRKFACLDMPEYPGEHDDILIGFDNAADRDRFAESLPAATQTSRSVSFKRKI